MRGISSSCRQLGLKITRLHGVFAPNSAHRARVTPGQRGKGNLDLGSSTSMVGRQLGEIVIDVEAGIGQGDIDIDDGESINTQLNDAMEILAE